jgi:hypothetical protein
MQTLEELQKDQTKAQAVVNDIKSQIEDRLRMTVVLCSCGHGAAIGSLTYIQTHWYESPHGCTGGDMWHQDEGQYDCPSCGCRNRLYNQPDITKLKYLFGDIKKELKA